MIKTNSLISFRFSVKNYFNRKKQTKLPFDLQNIQLGSHQKCPACKADQAWLIGSVDRIGFLCDTVVCKECQLVFNDNYISEPEKFYNKIWGEEHWEDPNDNFMKRTHIDHYSWRRFSFVSKALKGELANIKNVLEIGCGDGCNLYPYHLNGYKVTGLDYDLEYLKPGIKSGMNLLVGNIFNNDLQSKFDLILIIHAFEHMQNLDEIVLEVKKYLNPNGIVYVEVPGIINLNRISSKSLATGGMRSFNNFLGYLQFQHNYHFDAHHLKWFWERNGYSTIDCDEWIRALFKPVSDNKDRNDLNKKYLNYNYDIIKHLQRVEKNFLSFSNQFKRSLRYLVNQII